ncbi:MAG: hypothetical protein ABIP27_02690 [Flavobacterium circumlabens]|uniref:hypothetical protein n=1 Tax=Flavobacterium circumlabens TaxID=2133765 RepID=UPI0032660CBD
MINSEKLEKLGFIKQQNKNEIIYYKGNYGLKYESNNWLIIAKHSGQDLTGMNVIETVEDLKKHYSESTGLKLDET